MQLMQYMRAFFNFGKGLKLFFNILHIQGVFLTEQYPFDIGPVSFSIRKRLIDNQVFG